MKPLLKIAIKQRRKPHGGSYVNLVSRQFKRGHINFIKKICEVSVDLINPENDGC